jgi:rod shape-determining protein MreD
VIEPVFVVRWLLIFAWTYLVFVLQSSVARELAIGGCAPHLLLAGLILMTARVSGRTGLLLAAFWGLLSDCLSDARLGADVIGFVLIAWVVQWGGIRLGLSSPWRLGALSAVLIWCAGMLSACLQMHADGRVASLWAFCVISLRTGLYTGAVVGIASLAAHFIGRRTARDLAAVPSVSNKWRMLTE